MDRRHSRLRRFSLPLFFAAIVFVVLILTLAVMLLGTLLLARAGLLSPRPFDGLPLVMLALVSLLLGTVIAVVISRRPLSPLQEIMDATDKIAAGDYSVRVQPEGPQEFKDLGEKFNHMAEELGSVELLRTDFVNNFSHEFKTPIVSIRGFAEMLRQPGLTEEERREYLDIIIQEANRLTELSSHVLYLSKLEQQSILTDRRVFNVSEQIRLTVVMLERRWSAKGLEIVFDSPEVYLSANEELLQQIWLNLLDNAIKFSPEGGVVTVSVQTTEDSAAFRFQNQGEPLSQEALRHLFDKFYQADASHTGAGNGLGLTIARRIAVLHGGDIAAASDAEGTAFTVTLPRAE